MRTTGHALQPIASDPPGPQPQGTIQCQPLQRQHRPFSPEMPRKSVAVLCRRGCVCGRRRGKVPAIQPKRRQFHATWTKTSTDEAVDAAPSLTGSRFHPALGNISFWSCYVYSPRGGGYGSEASRLLCTRLKLGDSAWLPFYAGVVHDQAVRHGMLSGLFGGESVLVPMPGSATAPQRVWAAHRLALALQGVGLGGTVWTGVSRRFPVRKSATALNVDRPTVQQHYESLSVAERWAVTGLPSPPTRIVIVDDVITKGRTLLAAAVRLYEAFPHADIRAFALVRTMGFVSDVSQSLDPCQGVVRWARGDARREP